MKMIEYELVTFKNDCIRTHRSLYAVYSAKSELQQGGFIAAMLRHSKWKP
jgi:hypothetical protein